MTSLSPRWRKVLRDVTSNKTRTGLVVLSIAVGVFAIGLVGGARGIILRGMTSNYAALNAASATLSVDRFDQDLVESVGRLPGMGDAEGRRLFRVRLSTSPGVWRDLVLVAITDFGNIKLNKVYPEAGAWPPPQGGLLLERASLTYMNWRIGDSARIETPGGAQLELPIAGTAHDLNVRPARFTGQLHGYIAVPTLESLGESEGLNQILFRVAENPDSLEHVQRIAATVRAEIERGGRRVLSSSIPEPGEFWVEDAVQSMLVILGALGLGVLLMSAFLIVNTTSALLKQQVRHIGVMKAIGARTGQLVGPYLVMVLAFGLMALIVGVPLGAVGALGLIGYSTRVLNFNVPGFSLSMDVIALQVAAGIALPLVAAIVPILGGARITVREAISSQGLGGGWYQGGPIDRLLEFVPGISRPLRLSLRNAVRHRVRFGMTLCTLVLASAFVIGLLSVRESFPPTFEDAFRGRNWDVVVEFQRPLPVDEIRLESLRVPGVTKVEAWQFRSAGRPQGDGPPLRLNALPANSELFQPAITAGRWLAPEDQAAIVLSQDAGNPNPGFDLGDEIALAIDGKETRWRIVGITHALSLRIDRELGPLAYVNYPYLAGLVGEPGLANRAHVQTAEHTIEGHTRVAQALEDHFKQAGVPVSAMELTAVQRELLVSNSNVIVVLLSVMASLLAVVGGLGLMGTMSIGVLERTREFGVMRAIGASNGAISRIVVAEGVLIGVMSWVLGLVLAIPLSGRLSEAVGITFLQTPLHHTFSVAGALIWLGVVALLAALASLLPAWRASRLTVRQVLAYE